MLLFVATLKPFGKVEIIVFGDALVTVPLYLCFRRLIDLEKLVPLGAGLFFSIKFILSPLKASFVGDYIPNMFIILQAAARL